MNDFDIETPVIKIDPTKERQRTIDGLRELAQFLEGRPQCPVPAFTHLNAFAPDAASFRAAVKVMGTVEKDAAGEHMWVKKQFSGHIAYELNVPRREICERRVVGTRTIPAHTEEVVEWECGSILDTETTESSPAGRQA